MRPLLLAANHVSWWDGFVLREVLGFSDDLVVGQGSGIGYRISGIGEQEATAAAEVTMPPIAVSFAEYGEVLRPDWVIARPVNERSPNSDTRYPILNL